MAPARVGSGEAASNHAAKGPPVVGVPVNGPNRGVAPTGHLSPAPPAGRRATPMMAQSTCSRVATRAVPAGVRLPGDPGARHLLRTPRRPDPCQSRGPGPRGSWRPAMRKLPGGPVATMPSPPAISASTRVAGSASRIRLSRYFAARNSAIRRWRGDLPVSALPSNSFVSNANLSTSCGVPASLNGGGLRHRDPVATTPPCRTVERSRTDGPR